MSVAIESRLAAVEHALSTLITYLDGREILSNFQIATLKQTLLSLEDPERHT